jgi:hypothetical protein
MDRDALFDRSLKSLDAAGIDLQSLWEYIRSVGSFTLPFEVSYQLIFFTPIHLYSSPRFKVPLFPVPVSALNKYQYEMERPDADPQDPAVISTALELKRGMKLACRTNRDFLPKSLPFNADLNYFDLEKDFNINVLMRHLV